MATYDACTPDDVLCFAGAEEGIYTLYRTLLGADDHAIVVTPNYQSAETIPLSLCATTGVALDENAQWTLHIDQVAAAIRPDTRARLHWRREIDRGAYNVLVADGIG